MDPVTSEIIRSSLYYVSEEMGIALRNASYSPNIKERMDHSAAIFDSKARLLAQAEHIPVHLGSLPWGLGNTVDYCEKWDVSLEEGSMVVVNNPYIAGTHLNDVTVTRPVYYRGDLVGFAVNKAHHSDVGGKVPGSISVDAKSLFEEGVIVDPVHLMLDNEIVPETVSLLSSNSRTPRERVGDLKSQVAANVTGERRILETITRYGLDNFLQSSEEAFRYAERILRKRLGEVKPGTFTGLDYLEGPDGSDITIKVAISVSENELKIDYNGTAKQVENPLNAVFGVTLSGVYYVVRTLTGSDIPANHGAFENIHVRADEGTIVNPEFPAPVAGGNVETSQRNVDALYRAFAGAMPGMVPAASGGTMNNTMIGGITKGKTWAFYETIGVGLGGRNQLDGIDGIQCNMTNTMNTPIEEIERTFPLLIRKYEFRPDSSGAGKHRGGSGIIRAFEAQTDQTTITVLSERGHHRPWGLQKGGSGESTRVVLFRRSKTKGEGHDRGIQLPVKCSLVINKGDIVEIQTAGGGGYGDPRSRDPKRIEKDLETGLISKGYVTRSGYRALRRSRRSEIPPSKKVDMS